jgi:hypothetical protein
MTNFSRSAILASLDFENYPAYAAAQLAQVNSLPESVFAKNMGRDRIRQAEENLRAAERLRDEDLIGQKALDRAENDLFEAYQDFRYS